MGEIEVYCDFRGGQAVIRGMRSGGARLTVQGPCGRRVWARNYKTRKGAKIAMRRLGNGWVRVERG